MEISLMQETVIALLTKRYDQQFKVWEKDPRHYSFDSEDYAFSIPLISLNYISVQELEKKITRFLDRIPDGVQIRKHYTFAETGKVMKVENLFD